MGGNYDHLREGRVAGRGHLTIDEDKAREKLRRFRLADPHTWVLQLVRAASILEATEARFTIDADEVECILDVPLPGDVLVDLWSRGYGTQATRTDRAAYQLALGLSAATAMNPARIVVESATTRLTVVNNKETVEEDAAVEHDGTRIYLRERFRLGHLLEFFDAREGVLAEILALEHHCAFARFDVWVNGSRINERLTARHLHEVESAEVSGRFLLDRDALSVPPRLKSPGDKLRVALCKNDVLVEVHAVAPHEYPAVGVVQAETLQLDLSSLERVRGSSIDQEVNTTLVYGPYHALIAKRLLSGSALGVDDRRLRQMAGVFATWLRRQRHRVTPPAEGSEQLFDALVESPIWPRADGEGTISLSEALKETEEGRTIGTSDRAFDEGAVQSGPVVHLSDAVSGRAVRTIAGLLDAELVDRTDEVEKAFREALVVSDWREGGEYARPHFTYRREVKAYPGRGWLFVPTERTFGPGLSELRSVRVFVNGEVAEYRADDATPFGVLIEASSLGSDDDGNLERGHYFEELARKMTVELQWLVHDLALGVSQRGSDPAYRETLIWWLRRVLDGTFQERFLDQLGLSEDRARAVAELIEQKPTDEYLGPVHAVDLFRQWPEGRMTLAELRKLDEVHYVRPSTADALGHRKLVESAMSDSRILVLDDAEQEVVGQFVELRSARDELIEETLRSEYLSQPQFTDSLAGERVVDRLVDADDRRRIEVTLVDATWPGCEVFLVFEDRLLGTREFRPDFGRFRVILRSEHLRPNSTWSDAESTPHLEHLLSEVRALTRELLERWWRGARESGSIPEDPFGQTLYFGVSIRRLVDASVERDRPSLPAVTLEDSAVVRDLRSWDELAATAARLGFLPFVRGALPERQLLTEVGTALAVGHGVDDDILQHLFPSTRLRDVTRTVQLDRRDAGRHFREQLHYPTALLGALVEHPIEAAGLTGQIGFYGTGRDAGRAEVAVLHEGRLLTAVTIDLPIGHFRAFVSGETVRPNGELNDLESGLPEITEAIHSAAAQCLRGLFREFDDDDDMAHAALVEEVLRVIVWARGTDALPPFDLREAAETSRLFRSTRGERLDFRQVSALADGGALPIATSMTTTEALFVPEPRRRLIEEVFGEWTFRVVTGSDGEGAGGQHGERVADRRPSWLLDEAARRLRRICSGSDERMQRQYAVDLRWADRPLDGELCRVRGRQVRIDVDHPIVTAVAGAGPLAGYVVASLVTTEINRRRRRVSDAYELGLQRKLLEELTDE